MHRYAVKQTLADALHGQVLLAEDCHSNELVVIKRVDSKLPTMETQVHQELSRHGGHCHVLQLRDSYSINGYNHLVMDYCVNGDLFDLIHGSHLEPTLVERYFRQIAHGVGFMHRRGYAHRDLSLENVLLDDKRNCHLCDFGLAVRTNELRKDMVGKPFYMAPEMIRGHLYNPAQADVWSLGVMLFMMFTGVPLCERASSTDARFDFVQKHGVRTLLHAWKLSYRFDCTALDLLEKMLQPNPKLRLTMEQVLLHPFVQGKHLEVPKPTSRSFIQRWISKTLGHRGLKCAN